MANELACRTFDLVTHRRAYGRYEKGCYEKMKSYLTNPDVSILLLRQPHRNLRKTNEHYLAVRMLLRLCSLQTNDAKE